MINRTIPVDQIKVDWVKYLGIVISFGTDDIEGLGLSLDEAKTFVEKIVSVIKTAEEGRCE
jgi:hypothetical protein